MRRPHGQDEGSLYNQIPFPRAKQQRKFTMVITGLGTEGFCNQGMQNVMKSFDKYIPCCAIGCVSIYVLHQPWIATIDAYQK